jgi:hypothetical protein
MDLEQALDRADELAHQHKLGPNGYDYAAMFHTDSTVKTFVELEAGGKDAFVEMMDKKLYMPYTWRVRHFKEYEKNETTIIFTPDGQPYGFVETISENIPGAQLSSTDAQHIAETNSALDWNINFDDYRLVEASQKTEPSARIDHTFVYERIAEKINEGLYRLKIVVSGNKMTELTHFVKVPEAFNRRYAEMRSANTTIAWATTLIMQLLYCIGGCGLGLYWLIRKRWYIIQQPLRWAVALASAGVLVSINQLPFLWMHYNSAHSSQGFLIHLFLNFFISLLIQIIFFTFIIITAEGLTRRAFGHHLQLWSMFKSDIITSHATVGRTFSGYLIAGFNCAFVITFYFISTRYWGWWTPSEMLFDPNVLATYVPWFSPIAQSIKAGFIEECLFRAIPLAGAALLGSYCGKRNWWIGCALILQAVVFGGAHANYPMQPSYARLVELFIPSLLWGITYIRFGLLSTIIAHSVYDIIWFSLPLFVSQAQYATAYKIIIVVITLLPLAYILYARIRKGQWTTLPSSALNLSSYAKTIEDTSENETAKKTDDKQTIKTTSYRLTATAQKLLLVLSAAGFIAWLCTTPFTHDGVTITLKRDDAIATANAFLKEKNIELTTAWKTLPLIFAHYSLVPQIAIQHKFMWREGNKELYHNLIGTYLYPAHWTIRYAQFDTDIIQRTEEHKVMFFGDNIWRYHHQLPETATGAHLTQDEARAIAHTTLVEQFNLDPEELTEISATQAQLPHRRNWLFIFANPKVYPLHSGQARINITISGNEVIDAVRTIHVPEEWERNELNKQNILGIITIIFILILLFCLLFGIIIACRQKRDFLFSKPLFFTLLGILIAISFVDIINTWPIIVGSFNTSLPFMNQLFQFITSLILGAGIKVVLCACIITYLISQKRINQLPNSWMTVSLGIGTGLFFAGIFGIAHTLIPTNMPLWPHYESLGCSIPLIASLISSITHYIQITMICSLLYILVDTATQQWQTRRILFTLITALCGIAMLELPSLEALPLWIIVGTIIGLILLGMYRYIIRYDYALIPLATGSFVVLQIVQQAMFNAYPGATFEAVISACIVSTIAAMWYWYSKIRKCKNAL